MRGWAGERNGELPRERTHPVVPSAVSLQHTVSACSRTLFIAAFAWARCHRMAVIVLLCVCCCLCFICIRDIERRRERAELKRETQLLESQQSTVTVNRSLTTVSSVAPCPHTPGRLHIACMDTRNQPA